jgi:hypothetical protein
VSLLALQTSPLGLLPHGALKPRVETHPDYVFSYGPETAELMARAGRPLDPWQVDSVTLMLAVRVDGKWACFECCEWVSRQNGKGGILEARALAGFFLLGEELIMWSAHEYKTAMEAFRRVKALIRALGVQVDTAGNLFDVDGILVKVNNTNGEECFERLDTNARIKFIARSKGSGRGFSGDVNIIDEAFAYTPEQHAALLYTLSARPNPQIIYASSPPLNGESGEIMFDLRYRGDPTVAREPGDEPWTQDPSLSYRDWGLSGDLSFLKGIDLDDIANRAATNPALGIRITHETIARERRSTRGTPAEFARERLGVWPKRLGAGGGVLDHDLWAAMRDPESRRADGSDLALAVDVAPMLDHGSIGMYALRDDGLEHMQLIDYRDGTDWIPARLAELKATLDPICVVLDEKNGAYAHLADLAELGMKVPEDPEAPKRGDVFVLKAADASAAVGQFIVGFRGVTEQADIGRKAEPSKYRHAGQDPLDSAIKNAKTRPIGDAGQIAWGRKASEVDISPLVVITEARYGYRAWHDLVTTDYDLLNSVW